MSVNAGRSHTIEARTVRAGRSRVTGATHMAGGDDRTRTDDPLLAKQVLYQLSYVP